LRLSPARPASRTRRRSPPSWRLPQQQRPDREGDNESHYHLQRAGFALCSRRDNGCGLSQCMSVCVMASLIGRSAVPPRRRGARRPACTACSASDRNAASACRW
jgi:hypothetical protein